MTKPTYKEIFIELKWPLIFSASVILLLFAAAAYQEAFADEDQDGRIYFVHTLDMEGAIGERAMLEREVREIQGREAQERVENSNATERDREIAADYIMEHMS